MTTIRISSLAEADTQARYQGALKAAKSAAKAAGIDLRIRQNVMKCCRSCIMPADLGLASDEQPYAFTFGGQGGRIQWRKGNPLTSIKYNDWYGEEGEIRRTAYWYHDNDSAPFLAEAFRQAGFDIEWDGTDARAVAVKFPEPRTTI